MLKVKSARYTAHHTSLSFSTFYFDIGLTRFIQVTTPFMHKSANLTRSPIKS